MKKLVQVILLLLVYLGAVKLPLLLKAGGSSETAVTIAYIVVRFLLIIWSVYLIKRYAVKDAGLVPCNSRHLFLSLIVLAFAAFLLYQVFDGFTGNILFSNTTLLFFLMTLTIGFAEELFFRSFVQNYLMQQNQDATRLKVIFVTSLLFGLVHYSNLWEQSFLETTAQVLIAISLGFLFGCLLFKTKTIYPIAVLHALIDFGSLMDKHFKPAEQVTLAPTTQQVLLKLGVSFVVAVVITGIGFLALRWPFKKEAQLEPSTLKHP